jgi:hypothetical protein
LTVYSDVSLNQRLFVGGDVSLNGNLYVANIIYCTELVVKSTDTTGGFYFADLVTVSGGIISTTDVSFNNRLFVGGDVSINQRLLVLGDVSMNGNVVISKDLTIPFVLPIGGNVISLEVGEHIPKKYQDIYLDNITNNCNNYLITSWAIRGQAGFGHVNCLDNHEIIPEIEKRGFKYLEKESMSARSIIKDNAAWFRNTILIFKKEQSDATHTNNTI